MPNPSLIAMLEEEHEFKAGADLFMDGGGDRNKQYFYLAGPMTNIPQFNFPAFHAAAKLLRDNGCNLVNPAELDSEIERAEAMSSPDGKHTGLPHVKTWRQCLRRDVDIVLDDNCVGIIVLEGWQNSGGARMETYVGTSSGVLLYEFTVNENQEPMLRLLDRATELEKFGLSDD